MTIQAKHKYIIIHPKDENGEEVKYSFMLTLSKTKNALGNALIDAIGTLPGIDSLTLEMGRYTLGLTVARTFDPDEILEELKRRLELVLSGIWMPEKELILPGEKHA